MEDYELWLRLGLQGEIWNLKEILTSYRLHDNQMSLGSGYDLNYIVPVTKAKKALAQKIDMHPIRCIYFDLVWKSAQILRSLHLRKKFSIENETP
jgi:hypothetical protein